MRSYFLTIQTPGSRRWLHFLLAYLFLSNSAVSQSLRVISTKDGLPQSFVSGLVQDDSSFVWVGTRNGLARFDGTQFKVFQHKAHDSATLASNLIIWIRRDQANQVWIEHESGEIDAFNPVTEKVFHLLKGNRPDGEGVQFIRRGWLVDSEGIFWGIIRGDGINSYNEQSKKITRFNRSNAGLPGDTVRAIAATSKNDFWVLTQQGISKLNKKTNQFTYWPIPYKQDYGDFAETDAIALDLHERKNGELMWGDRSSLFFFNPSNHEFRVVSMPEPSFMGIRWIRTGSEGDDYFENYGKVYRYTEQDGLKLIGSAVRKNFGEVKSFLVDKSGLVWMGNDAGGIHQLDLKTPFFQSFPYKKNFAADMLKEELGIDLDNMFNWTRKDSVFSAAGYHIRSVYDKNKRLYLALKEFVCYYDSTHDKFIQLPKLPLATDPNEKGIGIKGITITPEGLPMVIGYNGRILVYDFTTRGWEPFTDPFLIRNKFGHALLPLDILNDGNNIWITTASDGLLKIDSKTKEILQLTESPKAGTLPTNQLLGLSADPSRPEILWIGSYQGLIALNKKTLTCEIFSLNEGLPDNTIYSILPDNKNNLWFTTNKGICLFNPISREIRVFHTMHGLPGDEYNRFHHLKLPDGRLIFGSTDGWAIFNPLQVNNDSYDPVLALTSLRINNKELSDTNGRGILQQPLNIQPGLVLPYNQNTISIGFAGLEYSQPQDLKYRYQLEGYDNGWVQAGSSRQASYTRIPPGNYTLLVNASNTAGKWSNHIKMVKIKISPPWWSTKMAYLCYTIILAGLTWTFIRFRVSRLVMKQEMVLKEKETLQLKEIDDMKSRFFANITHEFRTPLTLIMGPAEQLKAVPSDNPQQSRLSETILNNAKQLLVLINQLMDLSKLEARAMQLHEQRANPAAVTGSVVHSFETAAIEKEIDLSFTDEAHLPECWLYADAIERIVYNLVGNALKFTPPGGTVSVILSQQDEKLQLVVTDTGTGIPAYKLPNIFERFYQAGETKLSSQENGTGIGLSLVKELVNQMGGSISVKSTVATEGNDLQGTSFTLLLPLRTDESTAAASTIAGNPADLLQDNGGSTESRQQILLVEDSASLADFITGILNETYQVTHVPDGARGLETAISMMPDLVISDVMMPVMDGYEFCSHLKTDIRTNHIPVILLTAKVSRENIIEGLSKGADDYLTKPFHPTELLLRIRNLLDRQQKLSERIRQELSHPALNGAIEKLAIIQDIFLTRLYELLDEHMDDSLFGVDQLADLMAVSRSSLHRKLKSITGMTTTEVVRNYRLKKATQYLLEGYASSETAYKTGFGSPAYFTKSFREVYGLTPSEFTQQLKK